jgi:hypothetical protein
MANVGIELGMTGWIVQDSESEVTYAVTWEFDFDHWFNVRPVVDAGGRGGHTGAPAEQTDGFLEITRDWVTTTANPEHPYMTVWNTVRNGSTPGTQFAFRFACAKAPAAAKESAP